MALPEPASAIRTAFHTNVTKLFQKTNEPSLPVNYRGRQFISREDYILLHEEEQHLADGIAFLAQTKEGRNYVSAVTLQQYLNPPSLVVRVASNKTPVEKTVTGLKRVLVSVGEYASAGKNRDLFYDRIFADILAISKERLLVRIRSRHLTRSIWPPRPPGKTSSLPLHERIDGLLESISSQKLDSESGPLSERLILFKQSLISMERNSTESSMGTLKAVVEQSWEVSNLNSAKSLEKQLEALGATEELYQSRLVLDIDKISKYLEICKDLMRFCRRNRTRAMFSNISLEISTAPPSSQPPGSRGRCCVHGEVQLILHHEQHPTSFPPRCIGSSKSACFLCDLFITEHGSFHISHTHQRLYEKWTIPETPWMTPQQNDKFERILIAMNQELLRLLEAPMPKRLRDNGPESRVHLLVLPPGAVVASPLTSVISQSKPPIAISSEDIQISKSAKSSTTTSTSTSTLTLNTITPTGIPAISVHYLNQLPLLLKITSSIKSSTLLVEKIAYIFDLEDIHSGQLQISKNDGGVGGGERDALRINAKDPALHSALSLRDGINEGMLKFYVHDDNLHELEIVVRWGMDGGSS